jgi:hypothetical protein
MGRVKGNWQDQDYVLKSDLSFENSVLPTFNYMFLKNFCALREAPAKTHMVRKNSNTLKALVGPPLGQYLSPFV